jgi:hypothetical protein
MATESTKKENKNTRKKDWEPVGVSAVEDNS